MKNETFDYYVYIVYAERDRRWARWLARNLNTYRLPHSSQKESERDETAHCRPVLHDPQNISMGNEGIRTELERSRFLFVVCSRNTLADTAPVDEVIRRFLDAGAAADRIIPFIVDDDPQPEKNCFSLLLQELNQTRTILGANVNDSGRRRAFLKAVAYMYGLKLEALESEESRRRKRARRNAAVIAAVCSVAVAVIGYRAWDYYVPKTAYFVDWTQREGIAEGIGSLKKSELAKMDAHITIVSSRGLVRECRRESADGTLCAYLPQIDPGRPVRVTYEYREDGTLSAANWYDAADSLTMRLVYVNRRTIDVYVEQSGTPHDDGSYWRTERLPDELAQTEIMDETGLAGMSDGTDGSTAEGALPEDEQVILRYLADYDEAGYQSELRYTSSEIYNTMTTDEAGVAGLRFERDGYGRATAVRYLTYLGGRGSATDADAYSAMAEKGMVCGERYTYSDRFDLEQVTYVDGEDAPTAGVSGYAAVQILYDGHHNPVEVQ